MMNLLAFKFNLLHYTDFYLKNDFMHLFAIRIGKWVIRTTMSRPIH